MRHIPILLTTIGFVLWSAAFLAIYGLQATGCHLGWQVMPLFGTSFLRIALIALLMLSVVATLFVRRLPPPDSPPRSPHTSLPLGLRPGTLVRITLAAVMVITFHGVFWLKLC